MERRAVIHFPHAARAYEGGSGRGLFLPTLFQGVFGVRFVFGILLLLLAVFITRMPPVRLSEEDTALVRSVSTPPVHTPSVPMVRSNTRPTFLHPVEGMRPELASQENLFMDVFVKTDRPWLASGGGGDPSVTMLPTLASQAALFMESANLSLEDTVQEESVFSILGTQVSFSLVETQRLDNMQPLLEAQSGLFFVTEDAPVVVAKPVQTVKPFPSDVTPVLTGFHPFLASQAALFSPVPSEF